MKKKLIEVSIACPLLFLTACTAWAPEMEGIIDSIEDTAVCVEVNDDAMRDDTDIEITVKVINKDPPKVKVSDQKS